MTQPPRHLARRLPTAVIAAALAVALLVGAPAGAAGRSASGSNHAKSSAPTIVIKTFSFSPATLKVKPGATVKVLNKTPVTHTVTSLQNKFNTGDVAGHASATFKAPTKAGRYPYQCKIHPYMTGVLVVT